MKITNVRWGGAGGQLSELLFEIDGKPCSTHVNQKPWFTSKGYFFVHNEQDGIDSDLGFPPVTVEGDLEGHWHSCTATNLIYSPWLVRRLDIMADAANDGTFEPGRVIGDAPDEERP